MANLGESRSLLNPVDRAAEILFGLIMALTFTCSISIANVRQTEIRQLLVGAISCNLAWGLVDAAMYLIGALAQKNRNKMIFDTVRNAAEPDKADIYIVETLPPVIASAIEKDGIEQLRTKIINTEQPAPDVRLNAHDLKKAIALFFLIFISTFPIVVPFVFIHDTTVALRVSNFIAIAMMFACGWSVAKYVGFSKWMMSVAMVVVGVILVAATILLGG